MLKNFLRGNVSVMHRILTIELYSPQSFYVGEGTSDIDGNTHPQDRKVTVKLHDEDSTENKSGLGYCEYGCNIFPTHEFEDRAHDEFPAIAAALAGVIFLGIACCFFSYDRFVRIRNSKIVDAAAKTNAIVLSLFPEHIRDQLLGHTDGPEQAPKQGPAPNGLKAYLSNPDTLSGKEGQADKSKQSRPIAELFPATTIMFGDVSV